MLAGPSSACVHAPTELTNSGASCSSAAATTSLIWLLPQVFKAVVPADLRTQLVDAFESSPLKDVFSDEVYANSRARGCWCVSGRGIVCVHGGECGMCVDSSEAIADRYRYKQAELTNSRAAMLGLAVFMVTAAFFG